MGGQLPERRNDVGSKVLTATIGALVGIIMTITFFTARDSLSLAHALEVDVGILKTENKNQDSLICDLKINIEKMNNNIEIIKEAILRHTGEISRGGLK